jgi:WD40 repeat protein
MSLDRQPCHVSGKSDLVFQSSTGQILTTGVDGLIKQYDINSECFLSEIDTKEEVHALALDPAQDQNILIGKLPKNSSFILQLLLILRLIKQY